MSKSAAAVMKILKEQLDAENPEQVLEKVQHLKTISQRLADDRGPLAIILTMDRVTLKYNHAVTGIANELEDQYHVRNMLEHYLREILGPQIRQSEIEIEVRQRLKRNEPHGKG